MSFQKRIRVSLEERRSNNLLRSRVVVDNSKTSRFIIQNGRRYWNFSSNDYLDLSHHPAVIRAWQDGAEYYGVGSSSSGHINGYTKIHYHLEEELAHWLGYARALLFISGFSANQSVILSLMKKDDHLIADRLSHASLLEAANLSQATLFRFHHNNTISLSSLLKRSCIGQRLVVTEGIFSMDGDIAPLKTIYSITTKANGWFMVDDAHGFGVIGQEGKGSCAYQNIKPELLVVTFGKSVGISGAAILCNEDVANYLLQYAQHLIYSTSMPPAQAAALLASLNIIRSEEGEERRQKLAQNIDQFRKGASSLNLLRPDANYAIQPLIVGDNAAALAIAQRLRKKNIWSVAIRPPAVPKNTARVRLTISAAHELEDILVLLEAIHDTSE